jgi:YVTN family beta-propeller protein
VINGFKNTLIKTILEDSWPSAAVFDSSNGYVYVIDQILNQISIINGCTNTVIKTISVGTNPSAATFDPLNGYLYIVNGGTDNLSVLNTSTNTVIKTISVGTNPSTATFDSSNNYIYVTNSGSGNFISGSGNVSVINGSSNTAMKTIPVGPNPIGAAFDSLNGYVYIANYNSGTISIISSSLLFASIFTESGLPSGTEWYVNLSNGNNSGAITGSAYTFTQADGTYSYNIATTDKTYHASAGSIIVNNSNVNRSVNFSKFTYTVTFTESGLSNGTHWNTTLNGTNSSSNGTTVSFDMVNGTYSYTVSGVSGYSIANSSGTVSVNGTNVAKNVKFTLSPSPEGLNSMQLLEISGATIAIIVVLGVVMIRRKK